MLGNFFTWLAEATACRRHDFRLFGRKKNPPLMIRNDVPVPAAPYFIFQALFDGVEEIEFYETEEEAIEAVKKLQKEKAYSSEFHVCKCNYRSFVEMKRSYSQHEDRF